MAGSELLRRMIDGMEDAPAIEFRDVSFGEEGSCVLLGVSFTVPRGKTAAVVEQYVQKGSAALMGGRTTLVIAHRLSTIEHADVIYVMEGGKVCEQGRHDELLERGRIYKRLVEMS